VVRDPQIRIDLTIRAIREWLKLIPNLKIVICDGSNYHFGALVAQYFPDKPIECICFQNDTNLVAKLGKGYGEGEIISYAIHHSEFLKSSDSFMKCNSKVWITNFDRYFKYWNGYFLCDARFTNTTKLRRIYLNHIDTRFYIVSKYFYQKYLFNLHELVDDRQSITLERCFTTALEKMTLAHYVIPFPAVFNGVSASTGEKYLIGPRSYIENSLRKLFLRYRTNYVASHPNSLPFRNGEYQSIKSSKGIGNLKITSLIDELNSEGAGSYYQRLLLAYLFCLEKDFTYLNANNIHSKAHYLNLNFEKVNQTWGHIFAFLGAKVEVNSTINYCDAAPYIPNHSYNLPFSTSYRFLSDMNSAERECLLQKVRGIFLRNLDHYFPNKRLASETAYIALHLRNVSHGDPLPYSKLLDWQLFTVDYGAPNNNPTYYSQLYANAVHQIILDHKIQQPRLHIYSTGQQSDFQYLISLLSKDIEVIYFLNTDPSDVFLDLIFSDILIASHSSLSWLASLLRSGPTYIRHHFRHFLTANTKIIPEVLYANKNIFEVCTIFIKLKLSKFK